MSPIQAADVRSAIRQTGWLAVLSALAGDVLGPALQQPGRHVPCPVHGPRPGSHRGDGFRLFADVDATGGGICATCGAFPDGLALLQWLFGWSFPEALRQTAGVFGLTGGRLVPVPITARPAQRLTHSIDPGKATIALHRLWAEALPPQHPHAAPLRCYLAGRGLDAAGLDARVIRLHPALPYWSWDVHGKPQCLGRFPAMLARVCSADGRAVSLHRTYLRADGAGKAPVVAPKKLMPHAGTATLAGGAIRLCRAETTLGVAEGIETALAVQAMTGEPVWACSSATLLARFQPPARIERLTLWADKDRSGAGLTAAEALRDRLADRCLVRIALPAAPIPADAKGIDWADVWLQRNPFCQAIAA
ncbi:hypothetical protein F2Q65_14780 [Thiohalocapsa marina]|uniref:DNA primase/helicase Gp4 N-terminal Bacteriophage T7-like domain-containing protein n=1 Tax=Thiohalocapsa marina TaxID=424902 RepID=A0A5M8FFQ0_9GAMM|nr:toprim domain-containing protein [Thiohalocapsa marina]KAA6183703.1 hypothetical protein F2Q65_14780 [Thiohalocapsa marina]